jgi:hypothetical protein
MGLELEYSGLTWGAPSGPVNSANDTSATGGYLLDANETLEGQDLRRFLQRLIAGITNLDGTRVRQSWQQNPPPVPDINTDWCGFGITGRRAEFDGRVYLDELGTTYLYRHEELDVLCTFYGPDCLDYAAILRDGLLLSQNREPLLLNGMGLVGCADILHSPELINDRFYDRADMTMTLRRLVTRTYPILDFASASGVIETDEETPTLTETFAVTQ